MTYQIHFKDNVHAFKENLDFYWPMFIFYRNKTIYLNPSLLYWGILYYESFVVDNWYVNVGILVDLFTVEMKPRNP